MYCDNQKSFYYIYQYDTLNKNFITINRKILCRTCLKCDFYKTSLYLTEPSFLDNTKKEYILTQNTECSILFDCRTQSNTNRSIEFDWIFVRFCSIRYPGHY